MARLDEETIKEISKVLAANELCELTTMDEFGFPVTKSMRKLSDGDLDAIWFGTHRTSDKIKRIQANSNANVHISADDHQTSLIGRTKVIDSALARKTYWRDWMKAMYPDGYNDSELIMIKFVPHYASLWVKGAQVNGEL